MNPVGEVKVRMKTKTPEPGCCTPLRDGISDAEAVFLAHGFAALSDPARLRLLSLIANAPGGEVCACDLVGPIGKSQPTVSHHLKVLFEAGLVEREKRGTWVWYRPVKTRIEQL